MRRSSRKHQLKKLFCATATADEADNKKTLSKKLLCVHGGGRPVIDGKFAPQGDKRLFIIGQDLETVEGFVHKVLPNPSGTTSYTMISNTESSLCGLEKSIDYGSGIVDTTSQMALVPNSMLVLGVCIKGALDDIIQRRCDASIDRFGDWIRAQERPVFLRIGYEFDGPWNAYDPELYKLAFKWIVSRLRFLGVQNFVSVWQSSTQAVPHVNGRRRVGRKVVDRTFVKWYPGNDVVDWMGTSYFHFDKHVHDAFLNFAREKGKPLMIAESAPQGYDLELGTLVDHYTNERISAEITGQAVWKKWFKPFFRYIHNNRDVIRAVAYINTPWKEQEMWTSGENGYWGDSRIQANEYIRRKFLKELMREGCWMLSSPEFFSRINWECHPFQFGSERIA